MKKAIITTLFISILCLAVSMTVYAEEQNADVSTEVASEEACLEEEDTLEWASDQDEAAESMTADNEQGQNDIIEENGTEDVDNAAVSAEDADAEGENNAEQTVAQGDNADNTDAVDEQEKTDVVMDPDSGSNDEIPVSAEEENGEEEINVLEVEDIETVKDIPADTEVITAIRVNTGIKGIRFAGIKSIPDDYTGVGTGDDGKLHYYENGSIDSEYKGFAQKE